MNLGDLITLDGVIPSLKSKTKKQALQELALRASQLSGIGNREIFEALLQRERLGSTGVGEGVAIPHGRIAGLERMMAVFARLETPIAFESPDDEPVDLVFLLLAPEHAGADHLKALARISRLLRDAGTVEKLRASGDRKALFALLTQPLASHAA